MSARIQACCESVINETPDVRVFRLRVVGPIGESLGLAAGRYVALTYPDVQGVLQQRCYSIIQVEAPNIFDIAIQRSGRQQVSDNLFDKLSVGDLVAMLSPAGSVTADRLMGRRRVTMVAGGIGLTLPMALIRELGRRRHSGNEIPEVSLVVCSPSYVKTPFLEELLALDECEAWFTLHLHLTREPCASLSDCFYSGRPTAEFFSALAVPDVVVICGGCEFAISMRQQLSEVFPHAGMLIEAFSSPASAPCTEDADSGTLEVADENIVIPLFRGRSLLDHLLDSGIALPHECKSGICGSCRIKVLQGGCHLEPDFALSQAERDDGYRLACCTFATGESLIITR